MPSKIEWTDEVWNPVTGCTKVSEGCRNCYAERMAKRLAGRVGYPADEPFKVTLHPDRLDQPLRWQRPRRIFVCSMGDLFHPAVHVEFIAAVFGVMAACPQHTFQVLTKRPTRMARWINGRKVAHLSMVDECVHAAEDFLGAYEERDKRWQRLNLAWCRVDWPLPNVWLGTSAEDQATLDERLPHILQTPAAVRFVSLEPLLGPIDFRIVPGFNKIGQAGLDLLRNFWVIVGGESGPGARPMHPQWVRSIRDQCVNAGVRVPFFFKQWGEFVPIRINGPIPNDAVFVGIDGRERGGDFEDIDNDAEMKRVGKKAAGRELDGRTWDEYPRERGE